MSAATALLHDPAWAVPDREPDRARPSLPQCLLLAGLLHALLVALIGTAPGAGTAFGEPFWGAIRIRLEAPPELGPRARVQHPAPAGIVHGRAPELRYGGEQAEAQARPVPDAGAPEIGARAPRPLSTPSPSGAPARAAVENRSAAARVPTLAAPATSPAPALPSAQGEAPAPVPQSTTAPPPDLPLSAPSTAPSLAPTPTVQAPVLRRPREAAPEIAAPATPPTSAPPALPEAAALPLASEAPPAASAAELASSRATRPPAPSAPAAVEPPLPAPLPQLPPQPLPPAPVTEPAAAATVPAVAAPEPTPQRASLPPMPAEEPAASPAAAQEPLAWPESAVRLRDVAPPLAAVDAGVLPSALQRAATLSVPGDLAVMPAAGAVAAPVEAAAPPAPVAPRPRLNLELPQRPAPAAARAAPRVLDLLPPPPERKSTLAEGIEKAARPDCRKAYGGMGALALIPLAADALRGGGCRW